MYKEAHTMNTYCLSISHPTRECWWFRATLPLLSGNPGETSSCCHLWPACRPRSQAFIPPPFRKPFSVITLALLLLSGFPPSPSAQGYWFSFCGFNLDLNQAQRDRRALMLILRKSMNIPNFTSSIAQRDN